MILKNKHQLSFLLLILLNCLSISVSWSQSNEGTNFWFGFMQHRDATQNDKVAMITSKYNTSGTISLPNQTWSQNFNVLANEVVLITLPDITENMGSEIINNVGVQVISTDPISLYIHQYHSFRSEATVVLPINSVGKEYFVMSYTGLNFNAQVYPSEFLIVATEDETDITITLSDESKEGKIAGTTFTVQLDAGETYQVQARYGYGDMTGSHLTSNKNFALFSGNSWTQVPSGCEARDNLLEQMFPVSTWGKQIVTVPNSKLYYDIYRILASEDNTLITIYGSNVEYYSLNAGEYVEYQRSVATYIVANKPIQVAQYIVGSECNGHPQGLGDPSMVLLNSIEQTRDTVTLYNSSFQNISENFINVIVATEDFPFVTFDGQPITTSAETGTIGLADEFTYARLQVSAGAHTITSDACGVIATAYGYGEVESYAYSGGASFKNINNNPIPEGGCLNDTIYFDTKLSTNRYSFIWDLGDGTTTTEAVFSHFYPNLGTYPVELIIIDECLETQDTLTRDLIISLRQAVAAEGDTVVCEGASFSLSATDLSSASFEWEGPNGYFSTTQFPQIDNARPEMSGEYEVIGIISGCATFPASATVTIVPNPSPDLGADTIFCNNDFETILDPGDYSTYSWQDGSNQSNLRVIESGEYWVEVSDQYGCIGLDTILLQQICPTEIYLPNVFSPNFDGTNDYFQVFGHDIIKMQLRIFDRWGGLVFESINQEERWDGTFNGEDVTEGVYVWMLEIEGYSEDGSMYSEVLSGSVTLIR
jgi:gliding motility-associated-like protein